MKVLVPGAIAVITAATVVIGANAVTGERGSDPAPKAADTPTQSAGDQFIHGYDPACVDDYKGDEGPGFIPLECIRRPGSDAAPIGLKPHAECPPDMWAYDPKGCEDAAQTFVPDFGPRLPTVTINGKVVELPRDVVISPPGIGEPVQNDASGEDADATPWVGWTTVTSGESWVKYSTDGRLLDSYIALGDESAWQSLLDALEK